MKNNKKLVTMVILSAIAIIASVAKIVISISNGTQIDWTLYTLIFMTFTFEFADMAKKKKKALS